MTSLQPAPVEARRLGPRAFATVRLLWWLLLPLAIAAPIASGVREHRFIAAEVAGFAGAGVELINMEVPTLEPFGPAAVAASIRFDETVVSVNGRQVATDSDARAAAAAVPAGQPLRIRLRDDGTAAEREVVLPRRSDQLDAYRQTIGVPYAVMFWLTYLVELLPTLIWITAGVLLFRTRAREAGPALLSVGALGLSTLPLWDTLGDFLGSLWAAPAEVLAPAAFLCLTWALTAFPSGRLDRRWQAPALIVLGLACAAQAVSGLLALFAGVYLPAPLDTLLLPGLAVAGFLIAAVALLDRWRRTPAGVARQQMKWAAGGLAAGLVLVSVGLTLVYGTMFVDVGHAEAAWIYIVGAGVGYLGVALIMTGLLVALLRHRLYDAESILGRSAVLGALTLAALAAWAAAETVLKSLLSDVLGLDSGPALAAVLATAGALVVAPMRKGLSRWTRRRFQPGVEALTDSAPERLADLKHTATPQEIAATMSAEVAAAVRSVRAALISDRGQSVEAVVGLPHRDAARWLQANGARLSPQPAAVSADPLLPVAIALPAAAGEPPHRWLLLGPRPDGTPPGADDRKAVLTLAAPIGRALEAAARREARDAQLLGEIESLRAEVRALSAPR